jgi:hypothetical protein
MSTSVPSRIESVQLFALAQAPAVHVPLRQSEPAAQASPYRQGRQSAPPQSMADSLPFFTPSEQPRPTQTPATQRRGEGQATPTQAASAQAPLTQTEPTAHVIVPPQPCETHWPRAQTWPSGQIAPKQSLSMQTWFAQTCQSRHGELEHSSSRQVPFAHEAPTPQTLPQVPQFFGSRPASQAG